MSARTQCANCGGEIPPAVRHFNRLYCTLECRERARWERRSVDPNDVERRKRISADRRKRRRLAWERRLLDDPPRTHCAVCGARLPPTKINGEHRKYCTHSCQQKAARQRMTPEQKQRRQAQNRANEQRRRRDPKRRLRRRQQQYAWKAANPEKWQEIMRRAQRQHTYRKKANGGYVSRRDWERLIRRHGGLCAYCGDSAATEQDHVFPLSRGGRHTIGNVLPACKPCNSSKHNRLLIEWAGRPRLFLDAGD